MKRYMILFSNDATSANIRNTVPMLEEKGWEIEGTFTGLGAVVVKGIGTPELIESTKRTPHVLVVEPEA